MKEEKFKLNSFIGGWYIDESICDNLITYFENNKHRQAPGVSLLGENKKIKDSVDIMLNPGDTLLDNYNNALSKCVLKYQDKYPEVKEQYSFSSYTEGYNIQKYEPKAGYHKEHCERDGLKTASRNLVFMTYLNTVKDGGTIFKYQNITTKAIKGLTLIWPSDFTHTHKGQIANETKYIITGWFRYVK